MYNLADDCPAPRGEVMTYAEKLLNITEDGATCSTEVNVDADNMRARRRASEHKRVNNTKMRQQLLPDGLRYPSYKEGLRAILCGDTYPFGQV